MIGVSFSYTQGKRALQLCLEPKLRFVLTKSFNVRHFVMMTLQTL